MISVMAEADNSYNLTVVLDAGHGGMDYLEFRDFVDRLTAGREMPIDVYDAAAWMVITCLTEASIANGGMPIDIPDFTNGKWIRREPAPKNQWNLDDIYPECFEDANN